MKKLTNHVSAVLALASGTIGLVALIFLVLLYAVELPSANAQEWEGDGSRFFLFGFLNDLLTLVAMALCVSFIVAFARSAGHSVPLWLTLLGVAGAGGIVLNMFAFIMGWISLLHQALYYLWCFVPLGIWHIGINVIGLRKGIIAGNISKLGIAVGIGELVAVLSFYLFGGHGIMVATDFAPFMQNYPLLIGTLVGGGVLGYIGSNLWMLAIGRWLAMNPHSK